MMVRDSVEARWCDFCQADHNHDVEYTRYASDHAEEHAKCRECGHVANNYYTQGEDS